MKLLGDDCWWAPRWARRLQNRIGLGEIDLPDERKRTTVNGRAVRPPVAASLVAKPRAPHDPTHPGAPPEPSRALRPGPASQPEVRPATRTGQPTEAKTTRFSAPGNSEASTARPPAPTTAKPPPPAPPPSAGQTRAMPLPGNHENKGDPAEPTTALPVMRPDGKDSDAATEKLNTGGQSDNGDNPRPRRRAGGGLSAQDLLRREGRL
jgi:trehalose monomycolate/heme transporter